MIVASWNVNSLHVRLTHVLEWLKLSQADVLALQELKLSDERFPHQSLQRAGYLSLVFGQKTYNGVALVVRSSQAVCEVAKGIGGFADESARVIAATLTPGAPGAQPLRVINIYAVNGQEPGSEKFAYKMAWLSALTGWLAQQLARYPRLIVMGDFNIVPHDQDSYDPVRLEGTLLHTPQERACFEQLLALGLKDSFRLFEQPPRSYSWWDYRGGSLAKNRGLRIDHLLVSAALVPEVKSSRIDRAPRHWDTPSDHAPVVLTLEGPSDRAVH